MTDIKHLLISGAKSRKYRQKLAALSNKPADSMLTVKFKLDTHELIDRLGDGAPSFGDYEKLYNEIEGVGKGTLTYLLFSVVLSGFRLFQNAAQARQFAEQWMGGAPLPATFPGSSAIAFDPSSDFIEMTELAPYLVVSAILVGRDPEHDKLEDRYVKDHLTTFNNNALSWLFGTGLKFLRKASVAEICAAYNIPEHRKNTAIQLKEAVDAIPPVSAKFSSKLTSLNNFRSCFGGHIDSWVSNYVSRLKELSALLSRLPEHIEIPSSFLKDGQDFITHSGLKRGEIDFLVERVNSDTAKSEVREALQRLLGDPAKGVASERDITLIREFSEVINRLGSFRETLDNSLTLCEEDKSSVWHGLKESCKKEWAVWGNLKKLPKLNSLSGGVPKAEEELDHTARLLSELKKDQEEYYQRLMQWVKRQIPDYDPFAGLIDSLQEKFSPSPKAADVRELAVRLFLHKIGNTVRRVSDNVSAMVITWFEQNNVFENKKDFNKYFYNKLGAIYVSPFSKKNQHGYRLASDLKGRSTELLESFGQVLQQLKDQVNDSPSAYSTSAQHTLLLLDTQLKLFYVSGIRQPIPSEIARPVFPDSLLPDSPLSASLKISLEQPTVSSGTVASIFSLAYKSLISCCYTVLNRDRFFLRTKFQWIGNHSLYYVPKAGVSWKLPERYLHNEKWQRFIDEDVLVIDDDLYVDIQATFARVSSDKDGRYADLLVQLPHDWYFRLPVADLKNAARVAALELSKDNYKEAKGSCTQLKAELKKFSLATACRLIGPSSLKHRLDEILISGDKISVSEITLLVDLPVDQQYRADGSVNLTYGEPTLSIAVPLSREAVILNNGTAPFRRVVAIDQGEAGLAYAVFDLQDVGNPVAEPVATGTIRLPSIRRLIGTVNTFRKKKSTTQKFTQRFDSTMFNLRENVAGDVCGVIVGLMQRFNAFPVLERDVGNLESGSSQLKLVYKAVNARFLLSDVDMQNTTRGAWWFNPGKYCFWKTNLLRVAGDNMTVKKKDLTKVGDKQYRELKIYPGSWVRAAGTSQICSCCGRNALAILTKLQTENPKQKFHINANGETTIGGEVIRLYHRPDNKTRVPTLKGKRSYNAINERAPWTEPEMEHDVDLASLRRLIKANLRRAPRSMLSKDTSQSRYYCVFKDCAWHNQEHHADINAAVNIGRRFLSEVIRAPGQADL